MERTAPRKVPNWNDWLLGMAYYTACRSKDPHTQHGAIIVDEHNRIIGSGYNGPPPGLVDYLIDWSRPNKYDWVIHAEENAMINAQKMDLAGCTIYITGRPCPACVLRMAARRLRRVFYGQTQTNSLSDEKWALCQQIASAASIDLVELTVPPSPHNRGNDHG